MAKGWPVKSKGTFAPGFGTKKGPARKERDTKKVTPPAGKKETVQGRMIHPVQNQMTVQGRMIYN